MREAERIGTGDDVFGGSSRRQGKAKGSSGIRAKPKQPAIRRQTEPFIYRPKPDPPINILIEDGSDTHPWSAPPVLENVNRFSAVAGKVADYGRSCTF